MGRDKIILIYQQNNNSHYFIHFNQIISDRKAYSIMFIERTIQSTLVISKSKGPSETLRDIRISTFQMCRTEENTNRTTKFHKLTCNLTPLVVRNIC